MSKLKKADKGIDKSLLAIVTVLCITGLVAITDASGPLAFESFGDRYYFLKSQFPVAVVGYVLMLLVSKFSYKIWEKCALPFFIINILLLIAVFIPGVGAKYLGASRWIDLGFTHLQPSEFIKLNIAIYLAKVASRGKKVFSYLVPVALTSALVMLQPDLGTTLVIVGVSMSQLFLSGVNLFPFFTVGVLGSLTGYLLIITSDYRKQRFESFLKVLEDPMNASYHVRQVLIALGSGGLLGVGIGQSKQKYLFLPETATDSIFPVIAEEVGFIGAFLVVLVFTVLIIKGITIAKNAPDKFSSILAMGITSWLGIQALLNLGSMVALIPITGVPLPFISYGGTSLLCVMIASGIMLSISRDVSLANNGKERFEHIRNHG